MTQYADQNQGISLAASTPQFAFDALNIAFSAGNTGLKASNAIQIFLVVAVLWADFFRLTVVEFFLQLSKLLRSFV